MNKSLWKKPLALGLAFTMMLSLAACGKNSDGGNTSSDSAKFGDVKNMVFSGSELDMSAVKGDPSSVVMAGDKLYFTATEWPEYDEEEENSTDESTSEETTQAEDTSEEAVTEDVAENTSEETTEIEETTEEGTDDTSSEDVVTEEGTADEQTAEEETTEIADSGEDIQGTTRIYSMNLDGTGITELCQPELQNNEYINYLLVDKEGGIKLFSSLWDDNTGKQTYYIMNIDSGGNITDRQDLSKVLELGDDSYVSEVLMDNNNRIVVISEQKIVVVSSDLKKVGEIPLGENGWVDGAAKMLDGNIIISTYNDEGPCVKILDLENLKTGDDVKLDISNFNSSGLSDGIGDYDFFYSDDKGIYGYSLNDKKTTKIIDYLASEIDSNNSWGIVPLSTDTLIGTGWSEEEQKSVFTLYSKVDPSEVKDKETITLGSMWGIDDNIRTAAIKFNKENDKYRIEFKDYSEGTDWEDVENKVNAEFAAGNIPDIMDLNGLSYEQYAEKGIFEDLTPYYEKDDAVSVDDILPSVRKAMEIDGKLYYVSPSFSMYSLIAAKKDVGDRTGWTFEEMKELLEEKGDGVRPFWTENKTEILQGLMYTSINDYIDWSTGKCNFDSDDFKSLLEIAGKGTDEETDYSEDAPSQPELIKAGKVLFADGWMDIENVEVYHKMYNGDITFIGYPCEDKQGSYFNFDSMYGIYSKSKYKEGAWEFIKTLMTKDYQATGYHIFNTPTNKDAFENYMKAKTTTTKYTDEYGCKSPTQRGNDFEVTIGPLSKEEEQLYRDLVNNTVKVAGSNTAISDIIIEEAKNYFGGQKSVDETAQIIQNRVTTYVNENR